MKLFLVQSCIDILYFKMHYKAAALDVETRTVVLIFLWSNRKFLHNKLQLSDSKKYRLLLLYSKQ